MVHMSRSAGWGSGRKLWPMRVVVASASAWTMASMVLLVWGVWLRWDTGYLGLVVGDQDGRGRGLPVVSVRSDSPAARLGVKAGWELVSVAGRRPPTGAYRPVDNVRTRRELAVWRRWHRWLGSHLRPGTRARLRFRTPQGSARVVLVATRTPLAEWLRSGFLSTVVGFAFFFLGLVLVLKRPDNVPARRLLVYVILFQGFLFTQALVQLPRLLVLSQAEVLLSYGLGDLLFNLAAAAMVSFVVAFVFPGWKGERAVTWLGVGLALSVSLAYSLRLGGRLFLFFAPGLYAVGMALLLVQYRRSSGVLRRKQIKWLLWGGGIPVATLVVVYGLALLPWLDVIRSLSVDLMTLSSLMFPVAVLMAVHSDRLFDIDPIVRRSLLGGLLLPVLVIGYARIVGMLGGALASWANPGFLLVVLLVVLLMLPGQIRVEELLDRLAGRNRFGASRRLQALAGRLASLDKVEDVAQTTAAELAEALALKNCAIFVADPLGQDAHKRCHAYVVGAWDRAPAGIPCSFLEELDPGILFPEKREGWALPEGLGKPSPVALLLLSAGSRRLGLLAAGPADHRGGWSQDMVSALLGASGALASALDRIQHRLLLERVRSMQAQVIHSGRLAVLGTFAAGLAHELNTPLGYIKANAQIVGRKLGDRPELAALVRDVEQGADQMHEVVANLRTFASLDHLDLLRTDINDSVRQTLKMLDRVARSDVRLEADLGDVPPVLAKPVQMNQVILNLVSNAMDASPAGGRVLVRTRSVGDSVDILVEDDGPGLPEDVRDSIFDPFFTTKPPGKGMGLGLSITRIIVEAHGGEITVENRRSAGVVARVRLPIAGSLEEE